MTKHANGPFEVRVIPQKPDNKEPEAPGFGRMSLDKHVAPRSAPMFRPQISSGRVGPFVDTDIVDGQSPSTPSIPMHGPIDRANALVHRATLAVSHLIARKRTHILKRGEQRTPPVRER
jgi:hypothetical protein